RGSPYESSRADQAPVTVADRQTLDPLHFHALEPVLGVGDVVLEVVETVTQLLHPFPDGAEVVAALQPRSDHDESDPGHPAAGEVGQLDGDHRRRLHPGPAAADGGEPGDD